MAGHTPDHEDLVDLIWEAIDNRNDIDVSLRDFAIASVDALPPVYKAAPDLLSALEAAHDLLGDMGQCNSDNWPVFQQVCQAIALARGEQP